MWITKRHDDDDNNGGDDARGTSTSRVALRTGTERTGEAHATTRLATWAPRNTSIYLCVWMYILQFCGQDIQAFVRSTRSVGFGVEWRALEFSETVSENSALNSDQTSCCFCCCRPRDSASQGVGLTVGWLCGSVAEEQEKVATSPRLLQLQTLHCYISHRAATWSSNWHAAYTVSCQDWAPVWNEDLN